MKTKYIPMKELKAAREQAEMSIREVSEALCIPQYYIKEMEQGKRMITLAYLWKFAKLYGVDDFRTLIPIIVN